MIANEAIAAKTSNANELGRQAFREGKPCDPHIPLQHFSKLDKKTGISLMESWMNGWNDECQMHQGYQA